MKILHATVLTTGLAVALMAVPEARAQSTDANAVDACQGALPNYEGSLRKRPLGINNEGTVTAFVSCSLRTEISAVQGVDIIFTNRNASAATVNCTLVDGVAPPYPTPPPVYQPKSISLSAGNYGIMVWSAGADNGGNPYFLPNLSCSLPVGTEINLIELDF